MTISAAPTSSARRTTVSVALPRVLALLLVFAAMAKTYQGWAGMHLSAALLLQSAVEGMLGLWLGSGILVRWSSRIALVAFVFFATVSLSGTLEGETSCGCFGSFQVPPTYTFLMDMTIVSLLIVQQTDVTIFRRSVGILGTVGMAIAGLNVARHWQVQTMPPKPVATREIAHTEPDFTAVPISTTEWVADIGTFTPSKTIRVLFRLTSPTHNRLEVRGVSVSCGCTDLPNPPQFIPATGSAGTEVVIHLPNRAESFESAVQLTTDSPHLPPLTLLVRGRGE